MYLVKQYQGEIMRKLFFVFIVLFFSFNVSIFQLPGYAKSENDVEIKVLSGREQFTSSFDFTVNIKYLNQELYNEKNFLSFHFYDVNGNEILWEGERIPFNLENDGETMVSFSLNLNDYPIVKDLKSGYLQFDIIDEKNAYWFSTSNEIRFFADKINYDESFLKQFVVTLKSAITDKPAIFLINSVCLAVFIFFLIRLKRAARSE